MERFIHHQNLASYRRLIAASERDPARNEIQHKWLLKLLADEEATDGKPLDSRHWFVLAVCRRRLCSAIALLATPKRQLRTR